MVGLRVKCNLHPGVGFGVNLFAGIQAMMWGQGFKFVCMWCFCKHLANVVACACSCMVAALTVGTIREVVSTS